MPSAHESISSAASAAAAASLWNLEGVAAGGLRVRNTHTGRAYLYGNSAGEAKWNTGTQDASTVGEFQPR